MHTWGAGVKPLFIIFTKGRFPGFPPNHAAPNQTHHSGSHTAAAPDSRLTRSNLNASNAA